MKYHYLRQNKKMRNGEIIPKGTKGSERELTDKSKHQQKIKRKRTSVHVVDGFDSEKNKQTNKKIVVAVLVFHTPLLVSKAGGGARRTASGLEPASVTDSMALANDFTAEWEGAVRAVGADVRLASALLDDGRGEEGRRREGRTTLYTDRSLWEGRVCRGVL